MKDYQRNKNQPAQEVNGGLTKLETFTMHAIQGLCANPNFTIQDLDKIPALALEIAEDALIPFRYPDEMDFDNANSGNGGSKP